MNIYVGNLSMDVTSSDLQETFEKFGQVASANVIRDRFSGESRGFGFVEMPEKSEAISAIKELNSSELKGQTIKVSEARPRAPRRFGERGGGFRRH